MRVRRRQLLQGVTFSVSEGVTAVIGVNGAGKTTLFRALAGLVASAGSITLDGKALSSGTARYAPQFAPEINSLSVNGLLGYLASLDGLRRLEAESRIEWAVDRCDLGDVRRTRVAALSGGEAKRLLIAQAILRDSPIVMLDEPTSGLDPVQKRCVGEVVKNLGGERIVLFSTHDMGEMREIATNFVALRNGSVVSLGRVAELAPSMLGEILGVDL